jgi:dTDP-4-dehydrorhamnose 3,5-epimerase
MAFHFKPLAITDVILVEPPVFGDERGYFAELYKFSEFKKAGIGAAFVQHNQSRSQKGVLRGLHYQKNPKAQGKLIRTAEGEIFDVAVDLRQGSATYGKWVGEILSSANMKSLYVPAGFAHGFCVLSDTASVFYSCTEEYAPELEGGMIWNDPDVNIAWPVDRPVVSARDARLPRLKDAVHNFTVEKVS